MNTIDTPVSKQDIAVDLKDLPRDMKRLLRMQWKEFIHFVEDAQATQQSMQSKKRHNAA